MPNPVYIYIYIYVCIYIVIPRQTDSLFHNSSVRLDTQDASNWDQNTPNFTLDLVSYHSAISVTFFSLGIMMHFVLAFFFFFLHF